MNHKWFAMAVALHVVMLIGCGKSGRTPSSDPADASIKSDNLPHAMAVPSGASTEPPKKIKLHHMACDQNEVTVSPTALPAKGLWISYFFPAYKPGRRLALYAWTDAHEPGGSDIWFQLRCVAMTSDVETIYCPLNESRAYSVNFVPATVSEKTAADCRWYEEGQELNNNIDINPADPYKFERGRFDLWRNGKQIAQPIILGEYLRHWEMKAPAPLEVKRVDIDRNTIDPMVLWQRHNVNRHDYPLFRAIVAYSHRSPKPNKN